RLFATGEAARKATGRDAEQLRSAMAAQREVLAGLRRQAEEILRSGGHASTEAVLRRVTTTLQALAASGSFAPGRPGQLAADRGPPGFEAMTQLAGAPEPKDDREERARAKREATAAAKAAAEAAREEARRAKAEAAERERRIAEAKSALAAATKARERAEKDLEHARDEEQAAERALRDLT